MRAGRKNVLSVLAVAGVVAAGMAGSTPAYAATGADLGPGRVVGAPVPAEAGGYEAGRKDGYKRGYADGVDDGNDCNIDNRKKSAVRSISDYDRGFADGYNAGYPKGYDYAYQKECK
jgi:hypothetical protein